MLYGLYTLVFYVLLMSESAYHYEMTFFILVIFSVWKCNLSDTDTATFVMTFFAYCLFFSLVSLCLY